MNYLQFLTRSNSVRVANLFASGEQGAWYDPSDMSTLFQDSAGTTPVTAVEQPVGRMLDKSGRGNHAIQATTTKRPVLSRRVNLYTSTENLSSVWSLTGATVTASGTSPTGSAAWLMSDSAVNSLHSAGQSVTVIPGRHTLRLQAKPQGGRYVYAQVGNGVDRGNAIFDLQTATVTDSSSNGLGAVSFSISLLTDGWLLLEASSQNDAGIRLFSFGISSGPTSGSPTFLGDNTRTVLFAEPSLTLATDAHLPYQRVNTAANYDADPAKFPAYLRCDGVDDAMVTVGNVDLSGTDKVAVVAGASEYGLTTGWAVLHEFSNNGGTNPGSWFYMSRGNGTERFDGASTGFAAMLLETAGVRTGFASRTPGGSFSYIRFNGQTKQTTPIGTAPLGSFGNYPLYLFARAGNNLYSNGRFYGLILRGGGMPQATLEAVERYMRNKMGGPAW